MAFDANDLIKSSTHVYTSSRDKHKFEFSEWKGITDSNTPNNSTIMPVNKDGIALTNQTKMIVHTFSDNSGTYSCYRIKLGINSNITADLTTCDKSEAEVTYYATTQYGDCSYTTYSYYKKKANQQRHQYALQLTVNIAFDSRIYEDCGAFLSTIDFTPMATDNPNKFHLLNVKSDGSGEAQYVEISMMDRASKPKIEDFSIIVTSGYNETTTVYGRNFKLYTYGKYKNSGSSPRWNYFEEESEYLLLNVVKLS